VQTHCRGTQHRTFSAHHVTCLSPQGAGQYLQLTESHASDLHPPDCTEWEHSVWRRADRRDTLNPQIHRERKQKKHIHPPRASWRARRFHLQQRAQVRHREQHFEGKNEAALSQTLCGGCAVSVIANLRAFQTTRAKEHRFGDPAALRAPGCRGSAGSVGLPHSSAP